MVSEAISVAIDKSRGRMYYTGGNGQLGRANLDGTADGVLFEGGSASHRGYFFGRYEYRKVEGAGHNLPQEKPRAFADAVLTVREWLK